MKLMANRVLRLNALLCALFLLALIPSCSPSDDKGDDGVASAGNNSLAASSDKEGKGDKSRSPEVESLVNRLNKDKERVESEMKKEAEPMEISALKNTAAAFFNTLIGDDDKAYQGYLLSEPDVKKYFPTDATVLLSGRDSSNEVNRRELKKWISGLIVNHGDVEIGGVVEEGGRLTARTVNIPFRAGKLEGNIRVAGAAHTASGWRFLRFVPEKSRKGN